MTQITEATFSGGGLKPDAKLNLQERQRVRLIVQSLDTAAEADRAKAIADLKAGIAGMNFRSNGDYPTRDELHK